MFKSTLVAICLTATAASVAHAQQLHCKVSQKYVCESQGCQAASTTIYNVIDIAKQTYSRCDARGCDTYTALASQSGVFLNLEVPGRGVLVKISDSGSTFHEVVTLMHTVHVSFGSCKRQ